MKRTALFAIISIFFSIIVFLAPAKVVNAAPPTNFQTQLIVGSDLNGPSGIGIAPDGRIFILERTGAIKIYKNGQLLSQPFVVLPSVATGDRGLIGIAFDPNFASNHWVYFYYTALDQLNYLVRFDATQDVAQTGPHILYQTYIPSQQLHVGGSIAFGPDGKLYFAVGDNGYPPNAQDLSNPHGKILRINKDGSVPADNPFVSIPTALPEIWAYGFRNPWRFQFDSVTGQLIGGDVGNETWEEVNHIVKGNNYGWPLAEGVCASCNFTNPIHTYNHDGLSSAVTGGFVYRGGMFPSQYQGDYFFADYARGFIRYINTEFHNHSDGTMHIHADSVQDFDANAGSVVDLKQANDGSFYYITYYPGRLYRVSYATDNHAPIANATANITKGLSPLTVQFSSAGSNDPDGQALTYSWNFGDNTSSTANNPSHTFTQQGTYTVILTVSDGTFSSQSIPIVIQVGIPPSVIIAAPEDGDTYKAGDTIFYTASATDGAGFDLHDADFTTEVLLHHDTHTHPFVGPLAATKSGTFVIPTTGEHSPNTWYEVIITAKDTHGLTTSESVFIYPEKSHVELKTQPAGLTLYLDGSPITAPQNIQGVINFQRQVIAPSSQLVGNTTYEFHHWSDGAPQNRTITFPLTDTSYTAVYQPAAAYQASYWNIPAGNPAPTIPTRAPDLTRQETNIDNTWNEGTPGTPIGVDNFVAQWNKTVNLAGGTYRFTATSDDGIRVYVDGQLIINEWQLQGTTTFTTDRTLTAGSHTLRIDYFEGTGGAIAKFGYIQIAGNPTGTPTPTPTPTNSFSGEYWNLPSNTIFPPSVPTSIPDLSRQDATVNFNWGAGSPGQPITVDKFLARWSRMITQGGQYRFTITADDGFRLFLNDQLVLNQWHDQAATTYTIDQTVPDNWNLRLEYYENGGGAVAELNYQYLGAATPTPTPTVSTTTTPTATSTPTATATPTPSTTQYSAKYWNLTSDATFPPAIPTTAPTLSRNETQINHNWGNGSPDPIINLDKFVAEWTKTEALGGTYKFTVTADDGIRLYVNNQLVINQWHDQAATSYTVSQAVPDNWNLKVEYYENGGGAIAEVNYIRESAVTPTPTQTATPTPTATATPTEETSFTGDFWNLPDGTVYPPSYPTGAAHLHRSDAQVLFNWQQGSPDPIITADHFIARWSRNTNFATAGTYRFSTVSDDGIRVFIDDQLIINQWTQHPPQLHTGDITLTAGIHNIKVEYFEEGGHAVAELTWAKLP